MKSINKFGIYWRSLSPSQKQHLVKAAPTDYSYLSQIANGHRRGGGKIAYKLNRVDENIKINWFF